MTENKKKRGRPKKVNPADYAADEKVAVTASVSIDNLNRLKEHFNDIANGRDDTPFPPNWDTLSKVDKISWLTANPRK